MNTTEEIGDQCGLSGAEASALLQAGGANELPSSKPRNIFAIAFEVVREPMFLLLVACGTIYLILGEVREAGLLLFFVFVVMFITLYQERKTERALEALRDLSSPRACVIRDGEKRRIPGREVVPGDLLLVEEGDRVPADALVLDCLNLSVDESLLTGESVPVRKAAGIPGGEPVKPGGDDLPFIFSGSMVVQGRGTACVTGTGSNTEIGKIGKALRSVETGESPLKKEIRRLVRKVAIAGSSMCVVVVVVYGITRNDWLNGVLTGVTMAMAMLPEEFPVVLTIFLALGAWRISRRQVLTRRVTAVETLGAAAVLCVDKTGTLTENRMAVAKLFAGGSFLDVSGSGQATLPEVFHELVEYSLLAGRRDPFDPMEQALKKLGERTLTNTEHLHGDWDLVREYPLSRELLALSRVWQSPGRGDFVIAAKGAPEAIADLCHTDPTTLAEMARRVKEMAGDGLRVLGVAKAHFTDGAPEGGQHDFPFAFVGLVGFADPVRASVPGAVAECREAGIRVVMITGDYPETALAIARQIGIAHEDGCVTGPELDEMDDAALAQRVRTVSIFARVVPEQKLRLVEAFKATGAVTAMTGDGVNDAPALKSADIGIAMGGRGTDVAREAASLVLLDDDFTSIVAAVRMGRRIFDNLRKAMAYIFSVHVPIAGMSLLPVLFGWPIVFFPIHIVFLELIIDPACSIVFEAEKEEADVMGRPPRDPGEPLFGRRMVVLSLLQGASILAIVLFVFLMGLRFGRGEDEARALAFTTLIAGNIALIMVNRSWSRTILDTLRVPNPALWWVVGGATAFMGLALSVPILRSLFRFSVLHVTDVLLCVAAGVVGILWFEALKVVSRHHQKRLI